MEKLKEKEKGPYWEKLNATALKRYLDKLSEINNIDPYDLAAQDWITDPDALPPLTYLDIVNYLVFGLSAYTLQEFKSYKSLQAHEQFCSGWVQDLLIHRPPNCKSTVVLAKVRWHFFFCRSFMAVGKLAKRNMLFTDNVLIPTYLNDSVKLILSLLYSMQ